MAIAPIEVGELTEVEVTGNGVFDVLMRGVAAQLDSQFKKGNFKGAEYSTVYLAALDTTMRTAVDFLMQRQKIALENSILEQQILLAQQSVLKMLAEIDAIRAGILQTTAQTALITQNTANAVTENEVLVATVCKLKAEYDVLISQNLKAQQEIALLAQKVLTEKAQITEMGVDVNSVVGRQRALYAAQTKGFESDAKQKVAKIMIDTWNVRRTTDEGTVADDTNKLADANVGRAVTAMLADVNA